MEISLEGEVAVVTGAGRGIGRAHALELGRRGARVVVNDVEAPLVDEVIQAIRDAGGIAAPAVASVVGEAGANAIIGAACDHFGKVDVLINNAGVLRTGYFEDLSEEQIDIVLETHLRSAFHLTRRVWAGMKERKHGRVVMTSSSSGLFSHQGLSNYAAAKAGLYGLTKALSFEGADHGITVNAILPYALSISPAKDPIPDMAKHYAERVVPFARSSERGDPALVAAFTAFLVSRECTTSGQAFSICNGRFARVFVAVADGWLAQDPLGATAEVIRDHFDEITDTAAYTVPMWLFDEVDGVARRVAKLATPVPAESS